MYERLDDGLADALTSQLWEMYGPTPTRLLHMWRWAKTNGAFLICDEYLDVTCAHSACKVGRYYMEKYQDESKSLETRLTDLKLSFAYRGPHRDSQTKELSELDPSLINFNERRWSDTADRLRDGELSSLSRFWTVSLTSIRTILSRLLHSHWIWRICYITTEALSCYIRHTAFRGSNGCQMYAANLKKTGCFFSPCQWRGDKSSQGRTR